MSDQPNDLEKLVEHSPDDLLIYVEYDSNFKGRYVLVPEAEAAIAAGDFSARLYVAEQRLTYWKTRAEAFERAIRLSLDDGKRHY